MCNEYLNKVRENIWLPRCDDIIDLRKVKEQGGKIKENYGDSLEVDEDVEINDSQQ